MSRTRTLSIRQNPPLQELTESSVSDTNSTDTRPRSQALLFLQSGGREDPGNEVDSDQTQKFNTTSGFNCLEFCMIQDVYKKMLQKMQWQTKGDDNAGSTYKA